MTIIDVTPGSVFSANMNAAPTGLVGTLTVAIYDPLNDDYPTAAHTSSIDEEPAGSGNYFATQTAPTIAGRYSVIWDNAGTVITEDLVVTYSLLPNTDLCTLADVRAFLKKRSPDTVDDATLQTLITSSSSTIAAYCSREFTPMGTLTRRFRIDTPLVDFLKYDLLTLDSVMTSPADAWAQTLVLDQDFVLEPYNLSIIGTYNQLRLSRWETFRIQCTRHPFGYVPVDITGVWGAAVIPPIVTQSAVVTVAEWYRSKVAAFSTVFNDQGVHVAPAPLPTMVCGWLEPFVRYLA